MTNTEKTTPYPDTGEIPVIGNVDEAIFRFMHAARTVGASLAVWRLPQSENYNIVVNTGPVHKPREIPLEELPTGFMFA
ncbi:MAG: hypothetical protein OEX02_19240, partial [Cyclobacteriaceae bacterium]|nr:hypothetical protein [Cyclobacteriaceae bacterium]